MMIHTFPHHCGKKCDTVNKIGVILLGRINMGKHQTVYSNAKVKQ